jgi:hypothetical protein
MPDRELRIDICYHVRLDSGLNSFIDPSLKHDLNDCSMKEQARSVAMSLRNDLYALL